MHWSEELRYHINELLLQPAHWARTLDGLAGLAQERHPHTLGLILFETGPDGSAAWHWSWPADATLAEGFGFRLVSEPLLDDPSRRNVFQLDEQRTPRFFGEQAAALWPLPQWGHLWVGFQRPPSRDCLDDFQTLAGLLHRPLVAIRQRRKEDQERRRDRQALEGLQRWSRQLQDLADRPVLRGVLTREALQQELLLGLTALLPRACLALHSPGGTAVEGLNPWLARLEGLPGLLLEEWPPGLRVEGWEPCRRLILQPLWRPRSARTGENLLALVLVGGGAELDRSTLDLLSLWSNQAAQAWLAVELHVELNDAFVELRQSKSDLAEARKRVAIADLASGLAHELNTPLGSIMTNLDLLRRRCRESPELLKPLERISREVERSNRLVESLLTFSREASAEASSFELNEVVGECLEMAGAILAGAQVELNRSPQPLQVWVNRHQLQSVILELLKNAAWAAPGGKIRVTCAPGPLARVDIEDSGPGVPPELASRIFDPFFTTREVGDGAGLGLAVSSAAASGWSGSLELLPPAQLGGALFRVTLPLA